MQRYREEKIDRVRELAMQVLQRVHAADAYANVALAETLREVQLTERDRFVCGTAYDIDRHTMGDVDYYWYHDMHCVQLVTRYRAKRDSWSVRLNFTPW